MRRLRETHLLRDVLVPVSMLADPARATGVVAGDCLRGDLCIGSGRVLGLRPGPQGERPRGLVLPLLVEPHCHLDKCHTADRLPGWAGSLAEAIALQAADKVRWTDADLRRRIGGGVAELVAAGVTLARSHIDWGPDHPGAPPRAWHILAECTTDAAAQIAVQPAALTDVAAMAPPGAADAVARVVRGADGALGAFVHGQPEIDDGLRALFRAADRFGLPLDFHADEGLAPGLRGVERIADMALATGHQGPILCGHACALSCLAEGDLSRVTDKLARAGIAVVTLPATNLFLQDRSAAGSPRRGLAPVRALQAAGVRVVVGGDNVRDAFCPAGRHDPLWSLGLAALAAQLDGPAGCLLPMITTDAARALGRDAVTVDGAPLQALQLLPAPGTGALLCGQVPDRQRLSDLILEDAA